MIFENKHFLLFPHKGLDGDCLGSSRALQLVIENAGGSSDIMSNEDPNDTKWKDLNIVTRNKLPPIYHACILVDCDSPDRTAFPVPDKAPVLIIDHHEETGSYGDLKIVDSSAASTGIIVEEIRKELQLPASKEYAEAILTTIVSDTGGFRHDNTDKRALFIASTMVSLGASLKQILDRELNNCSIEEIKVFQAFIPKIKFFDNGLAGLVIKYSDIKDISKGKTTHPAEFQKFVATYGDYKVMYILSEQENGDVKGSLRSKDLEKMDAVASVFGGGGHKKAAGFLVPKGNIEEIENKLKKEINKYL